jgi:hypothetical protein
MPQQTSRIDLIFFPFSVPRSSFSIFFYSPSDRISQIISAQVQRHAASPSGSIPLRHACELPGHGERFVGLELESAVLDCESGSVAASASELAGAARETGGVAV